MAELFDCRNAFARALERVGRENPRVVVLTNDSVSSAKLTLFAEHYPDRLFNVGIAEQNMVGMAAGLANGGKIPFVAAAACFLTARPLEQIKNDIAYTNSNVKLCGVSTGLAYGALGSTHHSIEDIAWLRVIANMRVIVPADPIESEQAVETAAEIDGPVYLRFSRMGVPAVHNANYRFEIGKSVCLHEGEDVTLIACGTMVVRALEAASLLQHEGIGARVLNMASIKPIDREAIIKAAEETRAIVTVEEHQIFGGLGGAVAEVVVTNHPVPMRILGVPGSFAPSGDPEFLLDHLGLTAMGIRGAAIEVLAARARWDSRQSERSP